jgi:hypothetical protein
VSPVRLWKRLKELPSVLPPSSGGVAAHFILPHSLAPAYGGPIPFALNLASRFQAFYCFAVEDAFWRYQTIWYRWRLIFWGTRIKAGLYFDEGGRLISYPAAEPARLNI